MDASWSTWVGRDRWIVHVIGELDVESGPLLREYLAAELGRLETPCTVDLSQVTFIDSSGLHALVSSMRRAELLERKFSLVLDDAGRVSRLLELTGLGSLFATSSATGMASAPGSGIPAVSGQLAAVADLRPQPAKRTSSASALAGG